MGEISTRLGVWGRIDRGRDRQRAGVYHRNGVCEPIRDPDLSIIGGDRESFRALPCGNDDGLAPFIEKNDRQRSFCAAIGHICPTAIGADADHVPLPPSSGIVAHYLQRGEVHQSQAVRLFHGNYSVPAIWQERPRCAVSIGLQDLSAPARGTLGKSITIR